MAKALAVLWRLPIHAGSNGLNSGPLKRGEMKTSIFSKGHYLFRHTILNVFHLHGKSTYLNMLKELRAMEMTCAAWFTWRAVCVRR